MKNIFCLFLLILGTTAFAQVGEDIKIDWPKGWKIDADQENEKMRMIETLPKKDDINNWTILGTEITVKGIPNAGPEIIMNMTFKETAAKAPKAVLTEIARDDKAIYPWIIYKIESPEYPGSVGTESQLYYAVQGKQNAYSVFVALKEKELPKDFVEKWTAIFKAAQIVARK
ncbi:MAG: hypothetical protein EOO48_10150 [Flavobacterium sp.]|nr:MAG: hypothetical protein EOO48_10150 [Flavobacterium sp.]